MGSTPTPSTSAFFDVEKASHPKHCVVCGSPAFWREIWASGNVWRVCGLHLSPSAVQRLREQFDMGWW